MALLTDFDGDADDTIVNFDRAPDSSVPAGGTVSYLGEYYAIAFVNGDFQGEITGDAMLTATFGATPEISGSITGRQLFPLLSPFTATETPADLTLESNQLTADGQVALDGPSSPTVSGADSTMFSGTFEVLSGRYGGAVSGPDAEHFIGGVEVTYNEATGGTSREVQEFGAIAASVLP
ncbi:MAG: hypothetical protein AAFU41_13720 [Pseudomonadota bacterium]